MDDTGFGVVVRTARIRRGWRQRDLASAVGVSDAVISRLERGHLDGISLGTIRAVARAVEIRVELLPKSRSANLERLVRAKHAALAEAVIRWLGGFGGWVARPELILDHAAALRHEAVRRPAQARPARQDESEGQGDCRAGELPDEIVQRDLPPPCRS